MGNKLFVVGACGDCFEHNYPGVYDCKCERFVLLKQLSAQFECLFLHHNDVLSIGDGLVMFGNNKRDNEVSKAKTFIYNVEANEWYEKSYSIFKDVYRCVLLPQF